MKYFLFIIFFSFVACSKKNSSEILSQFAQKESNKDFHKLEKLFITGDFDGDQKTDTIYQHTFSKLQKKEIEFAPNPMKTDWDEVIKWFYDQDADLTLTLNRKNHEMLHLGTAQGLYCLINIGDINKDGKDEIAFAIDKCDSGRTNTCQIYSWCKGSWQRLTQFGIHEDAFDWKSETRPKFYSIKGYLEKQNNVWKYIDYNQNEFDSAAEVGKMKILKLDKCI